MIKFSDGVLDADKIKTLEDIINRIFREWMLACNARDEALVRAAGAKADWQRRLEELSAKAPQGIVFDPDKAAQPSVRTPGGSNWGLLKSVNDLDLSVRAANCLQAMQIETIRDLIVYGEAELLKQKHLTKKVVKEIRTELAKLGLKLKGDK